MATVKQYALNLWRAHRTISQKLGLSVDYGSSDVQAMTASADVMLAGLIKILTDKGVITDGELTTVYTALANANYPLLYTTPAPEDGATAPDIDLG